MNALVLAAWLIAVDARADAGDAAEPTPAESLPRACTGAALDLDQIIAAKSCDVDDEARSPPAKTAIGLELSPRTLKLRAGKSGPVTITFRNLTDAPLPVDVDMTCGLEIAFEVEIFKGKRRADLPEDCGIGSACGRHVVRIALAPRGVARIRVPISATAVVMEACVPTGQRRPLRPGNYKLVVSTPLDDRPADSNQMQRRELTGMLVVTGP
jgi:hypothetical protein